MKRVVIDCETTGLWPNHHQILTLGMVFADITPNKITVHDERHFLIRHEEYNISKTAMRINKINLEEHHLNAIVPKLFCKRFDEFMLDNELFDIPILGHNVHFDINFLNAFFLKENHTINLCPNKDDTRYIWQRLKRKGIINPNLNGRLQTIANFFNIDYSGAHDALCDCHITAKVYQKLLPLSKDVTKDL
jgi:DNA polymerase III epsilon subunit-like protein